MAPCGKYIDSKVRFQIHVVASERVPTDHFHLFLVPILFLHSLAGYDSIILSDSFQHSLLLFWNKTCWWGKLFLPAPPPVSLVSIAFTCSPGLAALLPCLSLFPSLHCCFFVSVSVSWLFPPAPLAYTVTFAFFSSFCWFLMVVVFLFFFFLTVVFLPCFLVLCFSHVPVACCL